MSGRVGIASIGALLALVLQIVLAPNVAIVSTAPSFVVAYAVALAMTLSGTPCYLIAFALGMLGDLLGFGPVGVLPFILLVASFAIDRAQAVFGNGTLFVACVIVVVSVIVVHLAHAAFLVALASSYSAADALRLVAIPQSLYDSVLAVLIYLLLRRMAAPPQAGMAHIGPLAR